VPAGWIADPDRLRQACETAARTLTTLPGGTPSLRLLADQTAKVWAGISDTLNGLALLVAAPVRSLALLNDRLASLPSTGSEAFLALQAREIILAISNGLSQHSSYFDAGEPVRVRFTEINAFGVYVAPMSLIMVAAWFVTIARRRLASRFGLLRYVWHPALFVFAVYMIVLSSIAMIISF
jgi:hypothetical protein